MPSSDTRNTDQQPGPRRRVGRTVVRLDAAAPAIGPLPDPDRRRGRGSPGHVSMPVHGGRPPSRRIRRRMHKALGVNHSRDLSIRRKHMNNRDGASAFDGRARPNTRADGSRPLPSGVLPKDFAQRLERLKEASGLSWRGLARALGVDPKQLARWRKGVEPCGGAMHSIHRLAYRIPGGTEILMGDDLQLDFLDEEEPEDEDGENQDQDQDKDKEEEEEEEEEEEG